MLNRAVQCSLRGLTRGDHLPGHQSRHNSFLAEQRRRRPDGDICLAYPTDAPLPITETGYRSHFVAASVIAAGGGPVAYVDMWLETNRDTPAWREREQAARQPTLF